jgi:hypothetical protein
MSYTWGKRHKPARLAMRAWGDLHADDLVTPKYAPSPKGGTPLPMQVAFAGAHFQIVDGKLLTAAGNPVDVESLDGLSDLVIQLKANGHLTEDA